MVQWLTHKTVLLNSLLACLNGRQALRNGMISGGDPISVRLTDPRSDRAGRPLEFVVHVSDSSRDTQVRARLSSGLIECADVFQRVTNKWNPQRKNSMTIIFMSRGLRCTFVNTPNIVAVRRTSVVAIHLTATQTQREPTLDGVGGQLGIQST